MANPNPSPATRFKPGQSGNPKGKPKGTTTLNMILKKIGDEKVKDADEKTKLEFIMRKVYEKAAQGESWAVNFIADRMEGKPRQTIMVSDHDDDIGALSDDDLNALDHELN